MLVSLNSAKAPGSDEIQTSVLKELTENVALGITIVNRKSILTGKVPTDFKIAQVFRKRHRYVAANYRGKTIERITVNQRMSSAPIAAKYHVRRSVYPLLILYKYFSS